MRYRKRMFRESRERGMFESTEQSVCDQARAIRNNCWLSELELEAIKRQVVESLHEHFMEQDVPVEAEAVERDAGTVEEMNDAEDSIDDTKED